MKREIKVTPRGNLGHKDDGSRSVDSQHTVVESKTLFDLPIDKILPNPYQPRKKFSEAALVELSESIKTQGLLEPIIVAQMDNNYYLIAGERRLRGSKLAGLTTIKAILRKSATKGDMVIMALIENIQRENLSLVEEAIAYDNAITSGEVASEAELARLLGKTRDHINKKRAVAFLSPKILDDIEENNTTSDYNSLSLLKKIENRDEQEQIYKEFIAHSGTAMEKREWLRERTSPKLAEKREAQEQQQGNPTANKGEGSDEKPPFDVPSNQRSGEHNTNRQETLPPLPPKNNPKDLGGEEFLYWDCSFTITRELKGSEKKELLELLQDKVDEFLASHT